MGDLESAREIVAKAVTQRLGRSYDRGCSWLWSQFIPAVERVALSKTRRNPILAADGYYYIGNFHDINTAPRAGLRAYRKAVRLNPEFAEAWREMALGLGLMGDYRGEVRALRKALGQEPDDPEDCALDLKWALESVEDPPEPIYHADGSTDGEAAPTWHVCELLAEHRAYEALDLLKRKRSVQMRQLRAAAYGALGETERQLEEWEAIGRGRGWVVLGYRDWFFLRKANWNSPRFWRALRRAGNASAISVTSSTTGCSG
jgi:tetratricopeptide (TPR) repeat protein